MATSFAAGPRYRPMGFLQDSRDIERDGVRWAAVRPWVAALLSDRPALPDGDFPVEAAEREGVLPWLAFELRGAGLLEELGEQQAAVRHVLHHSAALHLFCERELQRLAIAAGEAGVKFLAIKGHAVARTLYRHTACRPTSDFDFLVAPAQVNAAQHWLHDAGYRPHNSFHGTHWLASQVWVPEQQGAVRVALDLHWDVSNRMYFRHRVPFAEVLAQARRVDVGAAQLQVPGMHDDLIIACVHLAAMDPGLPVQMRWLLDIRLLMASLPEDEIGAFVARAGQWSAIEACLVFGEAAARLDDSPAVEPVLAALRAAASEARMTEYDRTLRSRRYDLWSYWKRLPVGGKLRLPLEGVRRVLARSGA